MDFQAHPFYQHVYYCKKTSKLVSDYIECTNKSHKNLK